MNKDRLTAEDRALELRLSLLAEGYTAVEIIEIAGDMMANELHLRLDPAEHVIRRLTAFAIRVDA